VDILLTFFSEVIKALWDKGPFGMLSAATLVGWGSAAYLYVRSRGKVKKTEPTTVDYVSDIKKLHDKYLSSINELNEKYNTTILDLNEKRIDDIRDLARDYNILASNTLSTLDRLIEQLGSRRHDLKSTLSGDDDGSESN
jgi:hypothetical protein